MPELWNSGHTELQVVVLYLCSLNTSHENK